MRRQGQRLDGLMGELSAKERALLVLHSIKEGTEEDVLLRLSMPREQAEAFNQYMDLINGVNARLAPFIAVQHVRVEMLSERLGWLATLRLLQHTREVVGEYVEERVSQSPARKAKKARTAEAARHALVRKMLTSSQEETEAALVERLWQQLEYVMLVLAVTRVIIEEVSDSFDGEDPCGPTLTSQLTEVERQVESLRQDAAQFTGPVEVTAVPAQLVAQIRRVVLGEEEDLDW